MVMPSGDNSFYVDRPDANNNYGEFIGKELVEITRRMFPLSDKREDTFIEYPPDFIYSNARIIYYRLR